MQAGEECPSVDSEQISAWCLEKLKWTYSRRARLCIDRYGFPYKPHPPSSLGPDALANEWPRTSLYSRTLVASWWPTQPWVAEMISLLAGSLWEIPLRQDMLSQAWGMIWHPRPDLWKLGVVSEWRELICPGLSAEATETIINSRAVSMRRLYAFKWKLFTTWCRCHDMDPVYCPVASVLEFLQSRFSERVTSANLKVYAVAISANHTYIDGVSVSHHPLVSRFMQGSRWLRPFHPARVPSWDLSIVLQGLSGHPFEPLETDWTKRIGEGIAATKAWLCSLSRWISSNKTTLLKSIQRLFAETLFHKEPSSNQKHVVLYRALDLAI